MENYMDLVPNNVPKGMNGVYNAITVDDMLKEGTVFIKMSDTSEGLVAENLTNIKTILFYMYENINIIKENKKPNTLIFVYKKSLGDKMGVFNFKDGDDKILMLLPIHTLVENSNLLEVLSKLNDEEGKPLAYKEDNKYVLWTEHKEEEEDNVIS